jgi:hypothetical protein
MPSIIAWTISVVAVVIAVAVWWVLAVSSRRAAMSDVLRRRFRIACGACLAGSLVLSYILEAGGVLQATSSQLFPTLAAGLAVLLAMGIWVLRRSRTLGAVVGGERDLPAPFAGVSHSHEVTRGPSKIRVSAGLCLP